MEQKIRSNKELLQVFLNNQHLFYFGLCSWVANLHDKHKINYSEFEHLHKIIKSNKPFFYRIYKKLGGKYNFYWESGKIKPRIKWLKKHLK